jgi:hypothetical protein
MNNIKLHFNYNLNIVQVNMRFIQIWVANYSAAELAGCLTWPDFNYPRRKTVPAAFGARERPTKPANTSIVTT